MYMLRISYKSIDSTVSIVQVLTQCLNSKWHTAGQEPEAAGTCAHMSHDSHMCQTYGKICAAQALCSLKTSYSTTRKSTPVHQCQWASGCSTCAPLKCCSIFRGDNMSFIISRNMSLTLSVRLCEKLETSKPQTNYSSCLLVG